MSVTQIHRLWNHNKKQVIRKLPAPVKFICKLIIHCLEMNNNKILGRPPSPSREEAIQMAIRSQVLPKYNGVLIGPWVEDRIECPKQGTFFFPPKEDPNDKIEKPEMRTIDFRQNKLKMLQGNVRQIILHDSHLKCPNYTSTNDVVYKHLPKPLCGPHLRTFNRARKEWVPQPDYLDCYGNLSEWGLRKYLEYEWKCTNVSDYMTTLYEDTFGPPKKEDYLHPCARKGLNSSFTKAFQFKMTKEIERPIKKNKK